MKHFSFRLFMFALLGMGLMPLGGCDSDSTEEGTFEALRMEDIQNAVLSTKEIVGTAGVENQIPTGAIVLYQTDAGRIGKFEIQNYDRDLTIGWVTFTSTGAIFSQGSNALVRATFFFDLDSGQEMSNRTGNETGLPDFWWRHRTSVIRMIVPLNDVRFAVYEQ